MATLVELMSWKAMMDAGRDLREGFFLFSGLAVSWLLAMDICMPVDICMFVDICASVITHYLLPPF